MFACVFGCKSMYFITLCGLHISKRASRKIPLLVCSLIHGTRPSPELLSQLFTCVD